MFEGKYSKVLTIVLIIVIIVIIGLLGFLVFDMINKTNTTKQASEFVNEYEHEFSFGSEGNSISSGNTAENTEIIEENVQIQQQPTSNVTTSQKKKYNGYTVAGTLKIPSINVNYPILEEVTTNSLQNGLVVLYPSGDNLNQVGNTVIIGHNYRNGTFFSNLKKVQMGAKVTITDFRGQTLSYEIYDMFETSSTDTSFYSRDTNGLAEITLSTCTDASNDQRTIVFAKQI